MPHLDAERRIEIRQGLVEQKRLRLAHDGASDRDALALSAGELARLAVQIGREIQRGGRGLHLAVDIRARQARHLQAERDVAADAHMRIERIGLEHHRQAALGRRHVHHVLAVDQDLPAGDILQSGDQAQERGLPAAGRSDEHHEGTVLDIQIGILDDVDRPERFPDSLQRDLAHDLWSLCYLTAPKVSPRTSCRCVNHPRMMIGAMASVEAADSFAQNRPSGLE